MTPQLRKLGKGMPVIIALLYFLHLELVFSLLPMSMMAVILIGCTIAFLLYTRLFPHYGSSILALFALLYYVLHYFTDSPIPAGDAFTTAVGIVATWMLARRIVEHWIFWIVVNCVSVYLYYLRGLYPTMFLYICFAILAAAGLYTWKKKGIRTNDSTL